MTGAEAVQILTELPALNMFKRKSVLVVKARRGIAIDKSNMHEELIFMEFTRQVIEHLQVVSEVSFSLQAWLVTKPSFLFEWGRYTPVFNGVDILNPPTNPPQN